ncbi:MAG: FAD-binding protein, partial [Acidimicrobiia bacterium]|nr:FAD-binding protein [Acidimicrobiia bacterium]
MFPPEVVPTAENFDVVVIGGGPAGYAAALYGASAGLSIALVEKGTIGGTCLNVGCIPAKELLETAAVRRAIASAAGFGLRTSEPELDFSVTQSRKQGVIDGLVAGLSGLLAKRKVTVYDGIGTLHAGHVVRVSGGTSGDLELHGDSVILASGSVPRTIPGFDVDGTTVVTSDELLSIPSLPTSAVVIGGGAIGCEFASMMSDLGTQVTILEALPQILPGCDEDIVRIVLRSFKQRGIEVRTGVRVTGHELLFTGGTTVTFGDGESVTADMVVV